jgi:hypothetical protein
VVCMRVYIVRSEWPEIKDPRIRSASYKIDFVFRHGYDNISRILFHQVE